MRERKMLVAGLALACASMGAACGPGPMKLAPSTEPPMPDVPVPEGFKRIEKASLAYIEGGQRLACLAYKGKATVQAVSDFYREQMGQTHGWSRGPASLGNGGMVRVFEKGSALAVVRIKKDGGNAIVTILLSDPGGGTR
jgi:hypothetical protein